MSRGGDITLRFGTEERTFRLGILQWRKIQERCDAGPPELLARIAPLVRSGQQKLTFAQMLVGGGLGTWRIDDIREVLLQGLIGGGMLSVEAGALIAEEFDGKLSLYYATHAFLIMEASLFPPEDEAKPPGERKPRAKAAQRPSRAARSGSRTSTPGARP